MFGLPTLHSPSRNPPVMLSSWPCWMFTSNSSAVVDASQMVSPLKKLCHFVTRWLSSVRIPVQLILTRTQRFRATSVNHCVSLDYHESIMRVGKLGRDMNNMNTISPFPHVSFSRHFSPCNTLHWFFARPQLLMLLKKACSFNWQTHQVWATELLFKRCMLCSTTL